MKTLQIALNTVYQAARMKFAVAFIIFLSAVIILVPFVLRSDGTQRGMVQITLAYSLSVMNIVLSLMVIFLSTTLFCADIRDRVIFTIDTKPVRRWQFLLGKWLGITFLNIAVLAVMGGGVYGLVRYISRPGAALDEQDYLIMRSEVLTARAEVRPRAAHAEREFAVPYNTERRWVFEGVRPAAGERYVTVRFRQHSAAAGAEEIQGIWIAGDIGGDDFHVRALSMPGGELNEFRIPAASVEDGGVLQLRWRNLSAERSTVFMPAGDLKALYTSGTFGGNFLRSLVLILIRLSFLAAVGLAASTFLTFPVATLLTLFVFMMSLSLPTIIAVFMPAPALPGAEAAAEQHGLLLVSARRALANSLRVFPNLRALDPVPRLVDGVALTFGEMARAFFGTLLLRSGIAALIGVLIFNRRELAHMGYD